MSAPDDDLVAGLRARDPAAFARTYARYHDAIFRFLLRLSERRALAEDLFQETWLAVARDAPRLAEDSDLRAWLYAVARNRFRTHRRWSMLDLTRLFELAREALHETPSHEAEVGARAEARRASIAFGRLKTTEKEVLLLAVGEGLEGPALGKALGISAEAARQRLHRARAALTAATAQHEVAMKKREQEP